MEDVKRVHITSNRPRRDVVVTITPTDTASAVLAKAGLDSNEHFIIKPGDQTEFGMDEPVFAAVPDGGKLNVVAQSNVGATPSYAVEQGWQSRRDGLTTVYDGYFRAAGLRWHGRIREPLFGPLQFEIFNPPIGYVRQSKWAGCFHALSGYWMWISFAKPPRDVDSGIAAVNKLLKHLYDYRHTLSQEH